MAALALGTNCTPGSDANLRQETSGAAITIGQAVYRDSATGRVKLAVNTSGPAAEATGFAMSTCTGAEQPVIVQWGGTIENAATLVVGEPYLLSDTPGSVMPTADLGAGDYVTVAGVAIAATKFRIGIVPSGVAHA